MKLSKFLELCGIKSTHVTIINYVGDEALRAVRRDGSALQYVKEQTEAVALEAVKNDGSALQYVKEQTEAVALEAVKNDGYALKYVKEQTEAVALEAVKNDGYALKYVDKSLFEAEEEEKKAKKSA